MKFKVDQEVMIASGAMTGRKATVLSIEPLELLPSMRWYEVKINGIDGSMPYQECELEVVN